MSALLGVGGPPRPPATLAAPGPPAAPAAPGPPAAPGAPVAPVSSVLSAIASPRPRNTTPYRAAAQVGKSGPFRTASFATRPAVSPLSQKPPPRAISAVASPSTQSRAVMFGIATSADASLPSTPMLSAVPPTTSATPAPARSPVPGLSVQVQARQRSPSPQPESLPRQRSYSPQPVASPSRHTVGHPSSSLEQRLLEQVGAVRSQISLLKSASTDAVGGGSATYAVGGGSAKLPVRLNGSPRAIAAHEEAVPAEREVGEPVSHVCFKVKPKVVATEQHEFKGSPRQGHGPHQQNLTMDSEQTNSKETPQVHQLEDEVKVLCRTVGTQQMEQAELLQTLRGEILSLKQQVQGLQTVDTNKATAGPQEVAPARSHVPQIEQKLDSGSDMQTQDLEYLKKELHSAQAWMAKLWGQIEKKLSDQDSQVRALGSGVQQLQAIHEAKVQQELDNIVQKLTQRIEDSLFQHLNLSTAVMAEMGNIKKALKMQDDQAAFTNSSEVMKKSDALLQEAHADLNNLRGWVATRAEEEDGWSKTKVLETEDAHLRAMEESWNKKRVLEAEEAHLRDVCSQIIQEQELRNLADQENQALPDGPPPPRLPQRDGAEKLHNQPPSAPPLVAVNGNRDLDGKCMPQSPLGSMNERADVDGVLQMWKAGHTDYGDIESKDLPIISLQVEKGEAGVGMQQLANQIAQLDCSPSKADALKSELLDGNASLEVSGGAIRQSSDTMKFIVNPPEADQPSWPKVFTGLYPQTP